MSPSRPLARTALVAVAFLGLLGLGVGTASAHVEASSPDATAGGFGRVVFTVPTESDTASTVRVRIQVPPSTPLASVSVRPVPGWNVTTTSARLAKPLTTDDGDTVTDAVSVIDYTATAGGIPPGQFQDFEISGGPFPKNGTIVFPVVQTYSDGHEVAWIDPPVAGGAEPAHPAPVVHLGSGAGAAAPTPAAPSSATSDRAASDGVSGVDIAALVLGALGLVAGVTALVLGRRSGRRTVSS